MKLIEIAERYVGPDMAEAYLRFELPNEDPDREFKEIGHDGDVDIYRDGDVYLIHNSTGLSIGMWDELREDHPELTNP